MRKLHTIEIPDVVPHLFNIMFAQSAAKHGCGEFLFMDQEQESFYCSQQCTDCRLPQILAEFNSAKTRHLNCMVEVFGDDLEQYSMFLPDDARSYKIERPLLAPPKYEC